MGIKLAITGKGGVGKTTLAAGLSLAFAADGPQVLLVDADPDANLASTLGIPDQEHIIPLSEMKQLLKERAGGENGFFKLNPKVDDIPERYCVDHQGVKLLVMGSIKKAGSGCYCSENAFLKALITHLFLGRNDIVIMDMEAGIEHLGRGTSASMDALLIVVEPAKRSFETAFRIRDLAGDLNITRLFIVGSKVRTSEDRAFITEAMAGFDIAGFVPYHPALMDHVTAQHLDCFTPVKNALLDTLLKENGIHES